MTGPRLRDAFSAVTKGTGKTVLHITHAIDKALALAGRISGLRQPGRISAPLTRRVDRSDPNAPRRAITDTAG